VISHTARPLVIAAIERRLMDIRVPPTSALSQGCLDPEERLRQLMTKQRTALIAGEVPDETRAQTCDLLRSIERAGVGLDIRYLDAFNVYYELVDERPLWRSDERWLAVLAAYVRVLREFGSRLRRGGAAEHGPVAPRCVELPVTSGVNDVSPPEETSRAERRVLVLADHMASAVRIARAIEGVSRLEVHVLICRGQDSSACLIVLGQLKALLRMRAGDLFRLAVLAKRGRLHIRRGPLAGSAVIVWLQRMGFWVGLHAMGVIYREPVLCAFERGVLNAHIGLLPEYRGRSVMEWSVLAGRPTGVSTFLMDKGIDTGRDIVIRREIDVRGAMDVGQAKQRLFALDGEMYRAALIELTRSGFQPTPNVGGNRYYVMSRLLTSVVATLLKAPPAVNNVDSCAPQAGNSRPPLESQAGAGYRAQTLG
jgi:formyl transferase-like protein